MNGLYIVYGNDLFDESIGENRKILAQIKSFNNNGINCDIYKLNILSNFLTKIFIRLPFSNLTPKWIYDKKFNGIDFVYFRRPPFFNYYMYKILKKIKLNNKKTKILMEIPTFPYDKEIMYRNKYSFLNYPILFKDMFWRKKLKNVIDAIVTPSFFSNDIWNIKTIEIDNGIILDDYSPKKASEDDAINLISVANFKEWHGYERIIMSLHNYYKNGGDRKINIHFVGAGTELVLYRELVKRFNLGEKIFFYGRLCGKKLENVYNKSDIGLCSFGCYKKDIFLSKELKSREFIAKGLPIISGCKLDFLRPGDKYYLEFPNDASCIDFNTIIMFYDKIFKNETKSQVINNVRDLYCKNLDMDKAMKNVIKFLKIDY